MYIHLHTTSWNHKTSLKPHQPPSKSSPTSTSKSTSNTPHSKIPICARYLILAGDVGRLTDYDQLPPLHPKTHIPIRTRIPYSGQPWILQSVFRRRPGKGQTAGTGTLVTGTVSPPSSTRISLPPDPGLGVWDVRFLEPDLVGIEGYSAGEESKISRKITSWTISMTIITITRQISTGCLTRSGPLIHREMRAQKQSIIVVTHHAPLRRGRSSPRHAQNA